MKIAQAVFKKIDESILGVQKALFEAHIEIKPLDAQIINFIPENIKVDDLVKSVVPLIKRRIALGKMLQLVPNSSQEYTKIEFIAKKIKSH